MSQWEPEPDEDEQEEEEALEAKGKEQVVFLVDAARNMFDDKIEVEEGQEGRSSFSIVMETIVDFMKKRIVSGAKDEFAVVFYGTAKSENSMNHQNVYVYIKRDQPDASMIQQVSRLTDEVFQREIGSLPVTLGNQASLVQACDALRNGLWVTMDVLQTHASKGARHGIIMFSNTEDPAKGLDPSYRMLVMERGVPLKELGATLRFFPLISCKKPFNLAVFWQQLLDQLRDPDEEFQSNPTTQFSQLPTQAPLSASDVMDRLRSLGEYMKKCFQRRRSTLTLRWAITDDLSISCQLYDLFMEAQKPFSVKIRAEDNALLETSTTTLSEDTGVVLMSKIDKKQFRVDKVAERFPRVILSVEQLAAIKTFLPPGLKLLGFKPQSQLKDYHNMTHSSFLRPTERDIKGSTAVFKALLEAMAAKDNMAICSYVRTRNSQPCHVALIPQRGETNEEGYQVWAEGLHLIRLPNKDDIRHPEMDPNQVGAELPVAGPDHVKAARKLIQRLQFEDFSLGAVPNPILDRHFEVLEHLAMLGTSGGHEEHEMPDMDDFIDSTLPPDDCDALAKDELEAFKEAGPIAPSGGAGSKRKAPTADLSTAEAYAGMNWEELNRENRLTKLTLPDLKIYLKHHKLPMSGNKADIVERIQKHMSPDDL